MQEVNGTGSDVLISATVPIVADDVCNLAYGGNENSTIVFPDMMCTGNSTYRISFYISYK